MTQTTIYLSVTRGSDALTLDGSLYLFNELFSTINNVTKGTPQTVTNPPAIVEDENQTITNPPAIAADKSKLRMENI